MPTAPTAEVVAIDGHLGRGAVGVPIDRTDTVFVCRIGRRVVGVYVHREAVVDLSKFYKTLSDSENPGRSCATRRFRCNRHPIKCSAKLRRANPSP